MTDQAIETVKEKVQNFFKSQPGYTDKRYGQIMAGSDASGTIMVYGRDENTFIIGLGMTADAAYTDFVKRWKKIKALRKNPKKA